MEERNNVGSGGVGRSRTLYSLVVHHRQAPESATSLGRCGTRGKTDARSSCFPPQPSCAEEIHPSQSQQVISMQPGQGLTQTLHKGLKYSNTLSIIFSAFFRTPKDVRLILNVLGQDGLDTGVCNGRNDSSGPRK